MATRNALFLSDGTVTRMPDAGDTHGPFMRRVPKAATLTIASGVVTVTGPGTYYIDTEGGAATDDLTTVNGGTEGDVIVLIAASETRDVNITETGNLLMAGTSFGLGNLIGSATFVKIGSSWHRLRGISL